MACPRCTPSSLAMHQNSLNGPKLLRDASHFSLSACVHRRHRGGHVATGFSDPPSHSDVAQRKFAFLGILGCRAQYY